MPGISVSKIPIPFKRAGISWSSYWKTLISATVENAAPTHVVLTFTTAQPSLGASDFTIAGFTVSSASWTGAVLTLVLSVGVSYYEGNFTITFVPSGETATVTNNISAYANMVLWHEFDDMSTITKDGTDLLAEWNCKLANGYNFVQATDNLKPTWTTDGIVLNQKKMAATPGIDAWTYYMLLKINTLTDADRFFGTVNNTLFIELVSGGGGRIRVYFGQFSTLQVVPVGEFFILKMNIRLGVNSWVQINDNARVVSNDGNNQTLNGWTLGYNSILLSNVTFKVIIANRQDNDAMVAIIDNYLKKKV